MKNFSLLRIASVVVPAGAFCFVACSSPEPEPAPKPAEPKTAAPTAGLPVAGERNTVVAHQEGVPGGVVVDTIEITAKVTAIDAAKRHATLVTPDGQETVFKAGPEVVNFDQIHVGDQVKATVVSQLVVRVREKGEAKSDGAATMVALAPKGSKPGVIMADSVEVTARVDSVDLEKHHATLVFPDGTHRVVAVRPDVKLSNADVGREVVIQATEAIALRVEKP